MTITIHDELADALVGILDGLGLKAVYKWSPGGIKTPCAVLEVPTIGRTEPDQAEDHIGADNWRFDFPVVFYVEFRKDTQVQAVQAELVQFAANWISAIDNLQADEQGFVLSGLCTDVKVTSAEPFATPPPEDGGRNQIGYETHVSLLTFQ